MPARVIRGFESLDKGHGKDQKKRVYKNAALGAAAVPPN